MNKPLSLPWLTTNISSLTTERLSQHSSLPFLLTFCLLLALLPLTTVAQTIRYVKAGGSGGGNSWANASSDLQAMINASVAGDQVWVAAGTYKPTSGTDRTISFRMKEGVAIYGGFMGSEATLNARPDITLTQPSSSILSGDIGTAGNASDNSYNVILNYNNGLTAAALLDGFVVTGGNANADFNVYEPGNMGGGLQNRNTSATIRNCKFINNSAQVGGAICLMKSNSKVVNCSFTGNSAAGGGAINTRGGSNSVVVNCSISSNSATEGEALLSAFSLLNVINCSISGNSSDIIDGAINSATGATVNLANCVVWGNAAKEIFNDGGTSTVSHSDIDQDGYAGENGNIREDPMFVDAATGNLRLQSSSPVINKGDNAANTTTTDLEGNPRLFDATIDMGAFEFQGQPCVFPAISSQPRAATKCEGEAASFSVTASGSNLTYQWKKNETDISGATSATYSIASVTEADAASYSVVVSGACGEPLASAIAALIVNQTPTITTQPSNTSICAGSNVSFTVVASGNGLTYQWQIDQGAGFVNLSNMAPYSGVTSPTLTITSATAALNGYQYRLIATGTCSPAATSTAATLTVNIKPVLTVPTIATVNSEAAKCGATVSFTASATGFPIPSITYQIEGTPITSPYFFPVGTTLVTATATNSCGTDTETFTVVVEDKTLPTVKVKNITVELDETGYVTIKPENVDDGSHDACGIKSLALDKYNFTSANLGENTVKLTVTDNNNNVSSSIATVTVVKRPTVLTYTTEFSKQYSDQVTFKAKLTDEITSNPLSGKTITFTLGTQSLSAVTGTNGEAVATLIITQAPGSYSLVSAFAEDNIYLASTDNESFTINPEDARVTYTGALFASTSGTTSGKATVTLSATIQDITAMIGDPSYDMYAGDIRTARVKFVNRDNGSDISGWLTPGLVTAGDLKTGTVTFNWTNDIGSKSYETFTVGIVIDHYYTRNASVDNTTVNVSKPLSDFITGGGFITLTNASGLIKPKQGTKNNFGFNVKYNKGLTNLQGNINTIVRGEDGKVYQVKGNVLTSLSVNSKNKTAVFNGKASIQDITNPLAPIPVDGNATLQVTITDMGEPGSSDKIGITVWNKAGGMWFASTWDGAKTVEKTLAAGNLIIRGASTARMDNTIETEPSAEVVVYPNPVVDKVTIDLKGMAAIEAKTILTDAVGKSVMQNAHNVVGESLLELDMSGLRSGLYIIQLRTKATYQVVKVIKQ